MASRPYRWLIVLFGLPALAIGLMFLIGGFLPKEHTAAARIVLTPDPETVWDIITDFGNQASWRTDVTSMEPLPDDGSHPGWREVPSGVAFRVTRSEPPRELEATSEPGLPFGGRWVYRLEPAETGTRLTLVEEGRVDPPLFRFMARFVFGHHSTLETYLEGLAAHVGAQGEVQRISETE
mgnify:FL=1